MVIDRFEPASQQQVAERLGVDRTTMVAIIDALEVKGVELLAPLAPEEGEQLRDLLARVLARG